MSTPEHLRQVAARTGLDGIAESLKEAADVIERRNAVIKLLEGDLSDAHERNAKLVSILSRARACIHQDRQSLADCSIRPDNSMEPEDAQAVAEYDALLSEISGSLVDTTSS